MTNHFDTKRRAHFHLENANYVRIPHSDVWCRGSQERAVVKPPRHFGDSWRVYYWNET